MAVLAGLPLAAFAYDRLLAGPGTRVVYLEAYVPEQGGWQPAQVRVRQGERVRLRVRSGDVVHGIGIAGLGLPARTLYPGRAEVLEFVAERPGRYPFFCVVTCSPLHPRMRGELVVEPASGDAS